MIQRAKLSFFGIFFSSLIQILFFQNSLLAQNEMPYCPPLDSFVILPHLPPTTQGFTGTCWSFSMVSLLESENIRVNHDTLKLSEMWFVYCDYMAKFTQMLSSKTDTFVEGSECNAVLEYIKKEGTVPSDVYQGKNKNVPLYDYTSMFNKLQLLVKKYKKNNQVNSKKLTQKYITILNQTMTSPPTKFHEIKTKKTLTPIAFTKEFLKLDPYDYYSFMSNVQFPFGQRGALQESDNWWNSKDYYNLSINTFISALKEALTHGYTVVISGDVSEKSYQPQMFYSWYNNSDVKNMDSLRLTEKINKKTCDDHSWHIVGFYKSKSGWWFYIKDSAFLDDPTNGYHFIHESYLIRKAVSMNMHKYAARSIMNGLIK